MIVESFCVKFFSKILLRGESVKFHQARAAKSGPARDKLRRHHRATLAAYMAAFFI